MKKNFIAILSCFVFPLCLLMVFAACTNEIQKNPVKPKLVSEGQSDSSGVFRARLIHSFCAYNTVQVLDSAFFRYGMNWTDAQGNTYQHVFSVKNHCDFGIANVQVNEIFNCKLADRPQQEDCMICLGFMETPSLYHNIQVIR